MIEDDDFILKCKHWPHSIGYSDANPDFHTYYFYNEDKSFSMIQFPRMQVYIEQKEKVIHE